MYSFGVILYEIVTRKKFLIEEGWSFFHLLEEKIIEGVRPTLPLSPFSSLLEHCWSGDASLRPSFSSILLFLSQNSQALQSQTEPIPFLDSHYKRGTKSHPGPPKPSSPNLKAVKSPRMTLQRDLFTASTPSFSLTIRNPKKQKRKSIYYEGNEEESDPIEQSSQYPRFTSHNDLSHVFPQKEENPLNKNLNKSLLTSSPPPKRPTSPPPRRPNSPPPTSPSKTPSSSKTPAITISTSRKSSSLSSSPSNSPSSSPILLSSSVPSGTPLIQIPSFSTPPSQRNSDPKEEREKEEESKKLLSTSKNKKKELFSFDLKLEEKISPRKEIFSISKENSLEDNEIDKKLDSLFSRAPPSPSLIYDFLDGKFEEEMETNAKDFYFDESIITPRSFSSPMLSRETDFPSFPSRGSSNDESLDSIEKILKIEFEIEENLFSDYFVDDEIHCICCVGNYLWVAVESERLYIFHFKLLEKQKRFFNFFFFFFSFKFLFETELFVQN